MRRSRLAAQDADLLGVWEVDVDEFTHALRSCEAID